MRFASKVWRHVPAGAQVLHVGFILRAGGRWNRRGRYGALYTALKPQGALAEYRKYYRQRGMANRPKSPRDLVSVEVDLDPVVDLTDPGNGIVDPKASFLTGDTPQDYDKCQALADDVRAAGYVGLIAPSAAAPGEKNLMIYIDGPAQQIALDDGGDRIPIK
ncbi:MAG: RES family NAD+ phosphorylase [Chloroflexi bacterium]|nr:RES family NAD+ phosphorylase [Chloroflexota bacterium]